MDMEELFVGMSKNNDGQVFLYTFALFFSSTTSKW